MVRHLGKSKNFPTPNKFFQIKLYNGPYFLFVRFLGQYFIITFAILEKMENILVEKNKNLLSEEFSN